MGCVCGLGNMGFLCCGCLFLFFCLFRVCWAFSFEKQSFLILTGDTSLGTFSAKIENGGHSFNKKMGWH